MPAFKSELLENKMIRGLIKGQGIDDTGNLGKAVAAGINLSSFTSDFKSWLFSYIKKYNEKYSTSATEDICFRQIAHKYAASSNQMHDNNAILKNILKVPFDNDEMDLIIDEIKNLAHLRTLQSLTIESVGLLEAMK